LTSILSFSPYRWGIGGLGRGGDEIATVIKTVIKIEGTETIIIDVKMRMVGTGILIVDILVNLLTAVKGILPMTFMFTTILQIQINIRMVADVSISIL